MFDNPALVELFSRVLSERPRPFLALYSTSMPFYMYIETCPAELKERGLFDTLFHKWPAGAQPLQVASVRQALVALVPREPSSRDGWWCQQLVAHLRWRCARTGASHVHVAEGSSEVEDSRRSEKDDAALLEGRSQRSRKLRLNSSKQAKAPEHDANVVAQSSAQSSKLAGRVSEVAHF